MAKDFRDSPYIDEPGVSELQERILDILEDAEIDTATNDAIMKLLDKAEKKKQCPDTKELAPRVFCGRCNEFEPINDSCAHQYGYI